MGKYLGCTFFPLCVNILIEKAASSPARLIKRQLGNILKKLLEVKLLVFIRSRLIEFLPI